MQSADEYFAKENPRPLSSGSTCIDVDAHPHDGVQLEDLAVAQLQNASIQRRLAQHDNRGTAVCIDLQANYEVVCVSDVGELLPQLRELRISHGFLRSLRDLGTCWQQLQIIWMTRCNLGCLDGISSLSSLREVYAAFNDVSDLEPLQELPDLAVLDLEGNQIEDYATVEWLSLNQKLQKLTLLGNPVATLPGYRQQVMQLVPSMSVLDDQPTDESEAPSSFSSTASQLHQPATHEVTMVVNGIKNVRVGVGAAEFDACRMLASCSCGAHAGAEPPRLLDVGLRPGSLASWMRFLQTDPASSSSISPLPTSAGSSSSAHSSRPPSGEAGLRRMLTASTSFGRPPSTGARPGTSQLAGTAASAGNAVGGMGLYWKKNRLEDPSILRQPGDGEAGGGEQDDTGSSLTYGLQGTFSGNFAKELHRWKSSLQDERGRAGVGGAGGLQSTAGAGARLPASFDDDSLLAQLGAWKEEAAMRVLQDVDTASTLLCTSPPSCSGLLPSTASFGCSTANVLVLDSGNPALGPNQWATHGTNSSSDARSRSTHSAPELTTARAVSSRHLLCKILNDSSNPRRILPAGVQVNDTADTSSACQWPPGSARVGKREATRPLSEGGTPSVRLAAGHAEVDNYSRYTSTSGAAEGHSRPASTASNSSSRTVVIMSVAGEMELGLVNPRPIQRCSSSDDGED